MKTLVRSMGTIVPLSVSVVMLALLMGCGGKKEVTPLPVGEMEHYRDPVLGFVVTHPKGWIPDVEAGRRARFFSAEGVKERFLDPVGAYPDGAMMGVDIIPTSSPDSLRQANTQGMAKIGYVLQPAVPTTIGGKEGTRLTYLANFGNKIMQHGENLWVGADSLLYEFTFAGFGDHFEAHKNIFAETVKGFEFPKPKEKGRDETLPSETMSAYDGKLFSFSYPDNFNFTNPPKGTSDVVVEIRGVRQDCSIRFDVFPAKGLTVAKVMEQNEGKYKTLSKGQATVGGQPALHFTYAAAKDVERQFHFMVKDDKVYRITMDWFKPQRTEYLAAYGQVLSSFKFK